MESNGFLKKIPNWVTFAVEIKEWKRASDLKEVEKEGTSRKRLLHSASFHMERRQMKVVKNEMLTRVK